MRNPELTLFQCSNVEYATAAEQLANCYLALRIWKERVKSREVDLEYWKKPASDCGAVACFGGHLASWPEFLLLPNAHVCFDGEPAFKLDNNDKFAFYKTDADVILFGCDMFQPREWYSEDEGNPQISDYQVVINRLEDRISFLEHVCLP